MRGARDRPQEKARSDPPDSAYGAVAVILLVASIGFDAVANVRGRGIRAFRGTGSSRCSPASGIADKPFAAVKAMVK